MELRYLKCILVLPVLYVVVVEVYYRIKKRCFNVFEFDNASAWDTSLICGWKNKKSFSFIYKHKFLDRTNRVFFNQSGLRGKKDPIQKNLHDTFRIILCGGTVSVGYELEEHQLITSRIEEKYKEQGFNVEVYNASCRNYSTNQLYEWYKEELYKYRPNLILYYSNNNHPRRNITFFEGLWSMPKPVHTIDNDGKLVTRRFAQEIQGDDDWVILNDKNEVQYISANTNSFYKIHKFLDKYSMFYAYENELGLPKWIKFKKKIRFGTDFEQKYPNNVRIKKISDFSYYWRITAKIIGEWSRLCKENGCEFMICDHLVTYNLENKGRTDRNFIPPHPLGFKFDEIPSRIHFPIIANEYDCYYCDNYALAIEEGIDCEGLFIHQNYAYPTAKLMEIQAGLIKKMIDSRLGSHMETYHKNI